MCSCFLPLTLFSVGLAFPSVEVRFENVNVEAHVYMGTRALPTLLNFSLNMIVVSGREQALRCLLHLLATPCGSWDQPNDGIEHIKEVNAREGREGTNERSCVWGNQACLY